MKIGALALTTGIPVETIRHYEHVGLLPQPPRSESNYRIYGPAHAERLRFIRHCRSLDMTLDEVRVLLGVKDAPQSACAEVSVLLDEHIGHVVGRIRELKRLQQLLQVLRAQCPGGQDAAHCGILSGLSAGAARPQSRGRGAVEHVRGAHARGPERPLPTAG